MYELLVITHILAGMSWIGGGLFLMTGLRGIRNAEGHQAADHTMARMEEATRVTSLAPFVVLATGITMVVFDDAWSFSQMWVYLAIGLFVVALTLGGVFLDRMERQMREAREEGRSAPDLFDRFLRLAWVEMVFLIASVFVMVYKPI